MTEAIADFHTGSGQAGCAEVNTVLHDLFGGRQTPLRLLQQQQLNLHKPGSTIFRVSFEVDSQVRSLIVKRLRPDVAHRCELVARRWLPAVGLQQSCPQLFGVAIAQGGQHVWHVYEDLGDWALDADNWDPEWVRVAVDLIARVHMRFADHPLLGECRQYGDDFGMSFYLANVRDAARALEALRRPAIEVTAADGVVRDCLLDRLHKHLDEQPHRAQVMAEWGGPETLLHGDLWTSNTFIRPTVLGPQALLIDWDHAGVGPISYDLSTFLYRFPPERRHGILNLYRQAVGVAGWRLPTCPELNLLFDTAECARYANRAMWAALALLQDHADWGFVELAEVEQWFEALQPVLP